jgi:pimeloyl-ACP methyl ester carboxylesterase
VVLAASDPRLSHDRRVLGPDLRGFGWSQAPSGDYGKAKFAADVLRLIDAAGLERVDRRPRLGGYTAMLLALDHLKRIERAVALTIAPVVRAATTPPRAAAARVLHGAAGDARGRPRRPHRRAALRAQPAAGRQRTRRPLVRGGA